MSGRLTTHVLDTASGKPAAGMAISLARLHPFAGELGRFVTNDDGRIDGPLLAGEALMAGEYELLFHVGAYFAANGAVVSDPPFLDAVPIRFAVADTKAHYHVPLVVTPWSYSTYRGS